SCAIPLRASRTTSFERFVAAIALKRGKEPGLRGIARPALRFRERPRRLLRPSRPEEEPPLRRGKKGRGRKLRIGGERTERVQSRVRAARFAQGDGSIQGDDRRGPHP